MKVSMITRFFLEINLIPGKMYSWIFITLVVGVIVAVFLILLCITLSFSTKSWINNGRP